MSRVRDHGTIPDTDAPQPATLPQPDPAADLVRAATDPHRACADTADSQIVTLRAASGADSEALLTLAIRTQPEGEGASIGGGTDPFAADLWDPEATQSVHRVAAVAVTSRGSTAGPTSYSLLDDADGRFTVDPASGIICLKDGASAVDVTVHELSVQAPGYDGAARTFKLWFASRAPGEAGESAAPGLAADDDVVGVASVTGGGTGAEPAVFNLDNDVEGCIQIDPATGVITLADDGAGTVQLARDHAIDVRTRQPDGTIRSTTVKVGLAGGEDETPAAVFGSGAGPRRASGIDGTSGLDRAAAPSSHLVGEHGGGGLPGSAPALDQGALDLPGSETAWTAPAEQGAHQILVRATASDGFSATWQCGLRVAGGGVHGAADDEEDVDYDDSDSSAAPMLVAAAAAAATDIAVDDAASPADRELVREGEDHVAASRTAANVLESADTVTATHLPQGAAFRLFAHDAEDILAIAADHATTESTVARSHRQGDGDADSEPLAAVPAGDLPSAAAPPNDAAAGEDAGDPLQGPDDDRSKESPRDALQPSNHPPIARSDSASISEDAAAPVTGNVLANDSDADSGDTITIVAVDGGSVAAPLVGVYGTVTIAADGSYSYTIDNANPAVQALAVGETLTEPFAYTVADGEGRSDSAILTITIEGSNDAPVITSGGAGDVAAATLGENVPGVLVVAADDVDAGTTLTYSIAGGTDAANFTIDAETGALAFAATPDYEAPGDSDGDNVYHVTIRVTDNNGGVDTQALTIAVTDANEAGVGAVADTDGTAEQVAENAAVGTVAGVTAFADDADGTDTVSYSLSDDAGGRFAIDANSGVVTVAAALDREAQASHTIEVTATSTDGSTAVRSFTIAVGDVDEFDVTTPADTDANPDTVAEDAADGTAAGVTAFASDADATTNAVTYSLDDDAGGRFAIDANSGVISVADATLLDYETASSHDVVVRATSADGSSATGTVTIAVTDANEAPSGLNLSRNAGIAVNTDGGNNAYLYSSIGSGGTNAFTIEVDFSSSHAPGTDVSLFNYHTGGVSDEIEMSVDDNGSGARLLIEIGGEQTVAGGFDAARLFDGAQHHVALTWESADGTWVVYVDGSRIDGRSGLARGRTIAAGGTIALGQDQDSLGGGFDSAQHFDGTYYGVRIFDDVRTGSEIADSAFKDVDGSEPGLVFDWRMDDLAGGTTSDALGNADLSVGNVTGGGWIPSLPTLVFAIPEEAPDGRKVGTVSGMDPDAGDTLTYSLAADAGGRFAIDANTGDVSVADGALLDYESATRHDIIVRVTDSGGLTYDETFTINVADGNDAPSGVAFAGAASDLTGDIGSFMGSIVATDPDAGDTITYALANDAGGTFDINAATGELTLQSGIGFSATAAYDVTVQALDAGGLTTSELMTIHTGTSGDDSINGTGHDDLMYGLGGNDTLDGGAGDDVLAVCTDGAVSYVDAVTALNPVAYWRLGEGSGTTANDFAGTFGGTYQNGVTLGAEGALAQDSNAAARFDGNNDYVHVAGDPALELTSGSISLWFNPDTTADKQTLLYCKYDGSTYTLLELDNNNRLDIRVGAGATAQVITADDTVTAGEWHHLVLRFGTGGMSIYLDGQLAGSNTDTKRFPGSNDIFVGAKDASGKDAFGGVIDDVTIFDTRLTPAEIQSLYDTGSNGGPPAGDNWFVGGGGNDTLIGGSGADTLDGGAGSDLVSYINSDAAVAINLGIGVASGGHATGDMLISIEHLIGSSHNDTFTGDSGDNDLTGGAGNDLFLFGVSDGDDVVHGGVGVDWIDTIQLNDVSGGPVGVLGDTDDWTLTITSGSIVDAQPDHLVLSQDAAGVIHFGSGTDHVTFDGIERIQWS